VQIKVALGPQKSIFIENVKKTDLPHLRFSKKLPSSPVTKT